MHMYKPPQNIAEMQQLLMQWEAETTSSDTECRLLKKFVDNFSQIEGRLRRLERWMAAEEKRRRKYEHGP